MKHLKASQTPVSDILKIAYEGQDPNRRKYRSGYEEFFNNLPVLDSSDELLEQKVKLTADIIHELALRLQKAPWVKQSPLGEKEFDRTIIGLESPDVEYINRKPVIKREGAELIIARWGNNHTSPVHGHAPGYLHEEIVFGKMRVNTYRIIDKENPIVRPVETVIATEGTFASLFSKPGKYFKREVLVHNFTSIGFSATMHLVPEHTRDGRDNRFKVEYFDHKFRMKMDDVKQISAHDGMYLRKGDVVLVRSSSVPEYGDHYIVITGPSIMKEHGMRPQERAIYAPDGSCLLDLFEPVNGLTLLKLGAEAKVAFHQFHDITMVDGEVKFPDATKLMD